MSGQDEKIFADGFHLKRNPNAPEFVLGSLSINLEASRATFSQHAKNGWLNLELKRSRGGNYYVEVSTWEPKKQEAPAAPADDFDDDIPF